MVRGQRSTLINGCVQVISDDSPLVLKLFPFSNLLSSSSIDLQFLMGVFVVVVVVAVTNDPLLLNNLSWANLRQYTICTYPIMYLEWSSIYGYFYFTVCAVDN